MSAMPRMIAMCSNPAGLHEHVPITDASQAETCFADCDCKPEIYVLAPAGWTAVGITCPACDGSGLRQIVGEPDSFGVRDFDEVECPTCEGLGSDARDEPRTPRPWRGQEAHAMMLHRPRAYRYEVACATVGRFAYCLKWGWAR